MRIAHLADLHLGFRAYSRLSAKGINQREADVFRAFKEALAKVAELQVDMVLMAGDIFHVPHPSNLAIIETLKLLSQFQQQSNAEIVMIAGNHESVRSSDNRCILELFKMIPRTHIASHQCQTHAFEHLSTLVTCIPHNALINLDEFVVQPNPDYQYNILMLHGTVDSDRINDYGGHDVPRQLLTKGWNYTACGHFHSFTELGNNAFYAGAIERTSNNIWQEANDQKGFIEFNLETNTAIFHALTSPRPTLDLPEIDALHLTPIQVDQLIKDHAQAVDVTDKLVRQKIINFPKTYQSQLDNRFIRQLQNRATHYLLDVRSSQQVSLTANKEKVGLEMGAKPFLEQYKLPKGIDRREFVDRGIGYISNRP